MNIRDFYAEVGKLLYAVAEIDGVISKKEHDELYKLIRTRMAHREKHTDSFGTNDAWYAAFEFDVAEDQGMTVEDAFESFTSFIKENKHLLDNDLKEICLMLADKMAMSYYHTNKKEKELINKLKEVLGTDHVGL
ncbi:MAG: hypothetical protein ACO29O_09470 [Chitinophagaceae bacterium]